MISNYGHFPYIQIILYHLEFRSSKRILPFSLYTVRRVQYQLHVYLDLKSLRTYGGSTIIYASVVLLEKQDRNTNTLRAGPGQAQQGIK